MDLGELCECRLPKWDIRNAGYGCSEQRSWGARLCHWLDRCGQRFLALWGCWLRLRWGSKRPDQRSMEVRTLAEMATTYSCRTSIAIFASVALPAANATRELVSVFHYAFGEKGH